MDHHKTTEHVIILSLKPKSETPEGRATITPLFKTEELSKIRSERPKDSDLHGETNEDEKLESVK